jgi:hypothetical protein
MGIGGGDLDNARQINGGTDGTLIGNDTDRLRVSSYIQPGDVTTYSASNVFTLANTATDVFTISGSATKTIKIFRILFYLTATTGSNATIIGLRRSSLNTGGTSTLLTGIPHDTNNAASTAVVRSYTANPTALGTLVGNMLTFGVYVSGGGTIGSIPFSYLIDNPIAQPIVLSGTSQLFAVNMNGVTFAGNSARATMIWTEE